MMVLFFKSCTKEKKTSEGVLGYGGGRERKKKYKSKYISITVNNSAD